MQVKMMNIQFMRHQRKKNITLQLTPTGEMGENNHCKLYFLFSFRRGNEPYQLSIHSNISYIRHKPGDFQVWKDYPHYASKPGGLKKGFDKLASKNIRKIWYFRGSGASLAVFSFFHMLPIIPHGRKLKKHQA